MRTAVLCALALILSACAPSVELDGETPSGFIAVVSQQTAAASTARIALTGSSGDQTSTFEGVIDLATGDMDLAGSIDLQAAAAMTQEPGPDGTVEVVTLGDGADEVRSTGVQIILIGDTAYYGGLDPTGAFISFDAGDGGGQSTLTADPAAFLADLVTEGTAPTEVGPGDVRGDATTRFQVATTVAQQQRRDGVEIAPGTILDDLPATITFDVDSDDLLRRVEIVTPQIRSVNGLIEVDEAAPRMAAWELWDFGVAVDLTPPTNVVEQEPFDPERLLPDDGEVPLIRASGSQGGGGGGVRDFDLHVTALGADAADAVQRVVDQQQALMVEAGWTMVEDAGSTPESRSFTIAGDGLAGQMRIAFHPEGANVTLHGQVAPN